MDLINAANIYVAEALAYERLMDAGKGLMLMLFVLGVWLDKRLASNVKRLLSTGACLLFVLVI